MHQAYFDETGTQNESFLLVAGFVAQAEEWTAFNQEFLEIMGTEEAARNFKAKDCKDQGIMQAVAESIRNHTASAFAVSICPNVYNRVMSPRFRSQHGSAYTLSLKEVTAKVGQWAEMGKMNAPIAYFFDAGHRNRVQADQYFGRVYNQMPDERKKIRLGSWTFADDAEVWPLKAADVLAYCLYRAAERNEVIPAMQVLDIERTRLVLGTHIAVDDMERLRDQLARLYARVPINRMFGNLR